MKKKHNHKWADKTITEAGVFHKCACGCVKRVQQVFGAPDKFRIDFYGSNGSIYYTKFEIIK